MTQDELRKTISSIRRNLPVQDIEEHLMQLINRHVKEVIEAPIRAGDRNPDDEIIEDGIREALVRQVQKEAAGL